MQINFLDKDYTITKTFYIDDKPANRDLASSYLEIQKLLHGNVEAANLADQEFNNLVLELENTAGSSFQSNLKEKKSDTSSRLKVLASENDKIREEYRTLVRETSKIKPGSDQFRQEIEKELRGDPSYIWNEAEKNNARYKLLKKYSDEFKTLNINPLEPLKDIQKQLDRANPFRRSGLSGIKFDFERGKEYKIISSYDSNLVNHFEKHAQEFDHPFSTKEEYFRAARNLAESHDPHIISFKGFDPEQRGKIRIYKYDFEKNILLILSDDSYPEFVSMYRPNPKKPSGPVGPTFHALTPSQYVMLKGVMDKTLIPEKWRKFIKD
jgi:hypothetical protein